MSKKVPYKQTSLTCKKNRIINNIEAILQSLQKKIKNNYCKKYEVFGRTNTKIRFQYIQRKSGHTILSF